MQTIITFTGIPCAYCGFLIVVPEYFRDMRRNDGRKFSCPNGHKNTVSPEPMGRQKSRAERVAIIQAVHNAEQAEAAIAETKGKL